MKNDEAELAALAEHLMPLLKKLPGEIVTGEEALAFDEPQQLVDLLTEVEPLLVERLQHQEATA